MISEEQECQPPARVLWICDLNLGYLSWASACLHPLAMGRDLTLLLLGEDRLLACSVPEMDVH